MHGLLNIGAQFIALYLFIPKILDSKLISRVTFLFRVIYTMITQNKLLSIYILIYLVLLVINLYNVLDNIFLSSRDSMWQEFTTFSPGNSPENTPSPGPSPGPSGPNGPDGLVVVDVTSSVNNSILLEQKRLTLNRKLYELTCDSVTANRNKCINSPNLVNLVFDNTDRDYMREHLAKFHSAQLRNENVWGYSGGQGFTCKKNISRERFLLFRDFNTPSNS